MLGQIIGLVFLLALGVLKSTARPNRFGPAHVNRSQLAEGHETDQPSKASLNQARDVSFDDAVGDASVTKPQERVPPRSLGKPRSYRVVWAIALLAAALLWAAFWQVTLDRSFTLSLPGTYRFVYALSLGGLPLVGSGIVAAIVWAITKKPTAAMVTWTVLLFLGLTFLSIGGVQILSRPIGPVGADVTVPPSSVGEASQPATMPAANAPRPAWGIEEGGFDPSYGTPFDPAY